MTTVWKSRAKSDAPRGLLPSAGGVSPGMYVAQACPLTPAPKIRHSQPRIHESNWVCLLRNNMQHFWLSLYAASPGMYVTQACLLTPATTLKDDQSTAQLSTACIRRGCQVVMCEFVGDTECCCLSGGFTLSSWIG